MKKSIMFYFIIISTFVFGLEVSVSRQNLEIYNQNIEDYMTKFIKIYSDAAMNGTSNVKITQVENYDENMTLTKYELPNDGVVRYSFDFNEEKGKRTIDYYFINQDLILVCDLTQVNSSEFVSANANDILYSNLKKYLIVNNVLYYYDSNNKIVNTARNAEIYMSKNELNKLFDSYAKTE